MGNTPRGALSTAAIPLCLKHVQPMHFLANAQPVTATPACDTHHSWKTGHAFALCKMLSLMTNLSVAARPLGLLWYRMRLRQLST